jgi:hypothetical protein
LCDFIPILAAVHPISPIPPIIMEQAHYLFEDLEAFALCDAPSALDNLCLATHLSLLSARTLHLFLPRLQHMAFFRSSWLSIQQHSSSKSKSDSIDPIKWMKANDLNESGLTILSYEPFYQFSTCPFTPLGILLISDGSLLVLRTHPNKDIPRYLLQTDDWSLRLYGVEVIFDFQSVISGNRRIIHIATLQPLGYCYTLVCMAIEDTENLCLEIYALLSATDGNLQTVLVAQFDSPHVDTEEGSGLEMHGAGRDVVLCLLAEQVGKDCVLHCGTLRGRVLGVQFTFPEEEMLLSAISDEHNPSMDTLQPVTAEYDVCMDRVMKPEKLTKLHDEVFVCTAQGCISLTLLRERKLTGNINMHEEEDLVPLLPKLHSARLCGVAQFPRIVSDADDGENVNSTSGNNHTNKMVVVAAGIDGNWSMHDFSPSDDSCALSPCPLPPPFPAHHDLLGLSSDPFGLFLLLSYRQEPDLQNSREVQLNLSLTRPRIGLRLRLSPLLSPTFLEDGGSLQQILSHIIHCRLECPQHDLSLLVLVWLEGVQAIASRHRIQIPKPLPALLRGIVEEDNNGAGFDEDEDEGEEEGEEVDIIVGMDDSDSEEEFGAKAGKSKGSAKKKKNKKSAESGHDGKFGLTVVYEAIQTQMDPDPVRLASIAMQYLIDASCTLATNIHYKNEIDLEDIHSVNAQEILLTIPSGIFIYIIAYDYILIFIY